MLDRTEIMRKIQMLYQMKENLRNDAMDPILKSQERLDLYEAMQGIEERIKNWLKILNKAS